MILLEKLLSSAKLAGFPTFSDQAFSLRVRAERSSEEKGGL